MKPTRTAHDPPQAPVRPRRRRSLALLMITLFLMPVGIAAAQDLFEVFPLDPSDRPATQPAVPTPPAAPQATPPVTPAQPVPAPDSSGDGETRAVLVGAVILLALAGIALVAGPALARNLRGRRTRDARRAAARPPAPRIRPPAPAPRPAAPSSGGVVAGDLPYPSVSPIAPSRSPLPVVSDAELPYPATPAVAVTGSAPAVTVRDLPYPVTPTPAPVAVTEAAPMVTVADLPYPAVTVPAPAVTEGPRPVVGDVELPYPVVPTPAQVAVTQTSPVTGASDLPYPATTAPTPPVTAPMRTVTGADLPYPVTPTPAPAARAVAAAGPVVTTSDLPYPAAPTRTPDASAPAAVPAVADTRPAATATDLPYPVAVPPAPLSAHDPDRVATLIDVAAVSAPGRPPVSTGRLARDLLASYASDAVGAVVVTAAKVAASPRPATLRDALLRKKRRLKGGRDDEQG